LVKYHDALLLFGVAFHEMLGHGSGKIFTETSKSNFNFDRNLKNPLDGKPITSWYKENESFMNRFGGAGCNCSSYEECRAELVALHFSSIREAWEVLIPELAEQHEELMRLSWIGMIKAGLRSLKNYSIESKKWQQAHAMSRYVILQCLLEVPGLINIKIFTAKDGKDDLLLEVNESIIREKGVPHLSDFLLKIQIYKTIGDAEKGGALYEKYSKVGELEEKYREIIVERDLPRRLEIHGTLKKD